MSIREYESRNIIWPLANSTNMLAQFSVAAVTTPTYVDLRSVMPGMEEGHAVSVQAEGGKIMVALGSVPTASISTAVGTGTNQCWPIPDGVSERYFKPAGQERGTGVHTATDYRYLQYFGSGTLRLAYSSLGPNQDTLSFRRGIAMP